MKDKESLSNDELLDVTYDPIKDEWVCKFFSLTSTGKLIPRAISCKSKEELIRQMSRVNRLTQVD